MLHGPGHAEPLSLSNPLLAGLQAVRGTVGCRYWCQAKQQAGWWLAKSKHSGANPCV